MSRENLSHDPMTNISLKEYFYSTRKFDWSIPLNVPGTRNCLSN